MLTKTEAMAKLAQEDQDSYNAMERKIDNALRRHDGQTFVECNVNTRVREKLMADYSAAGWTVEYHDDQRDGASLTFH